MARTPKGPTRVPETQPAPDVAQGQEREGYRLISESLYQTVLRITENSTISGPAAQVADLVNGLRDCPRTHAEPFPRAAPDLSPSLMGEDLEG